jgi:hypothetical protein
MGIHMIYTVPMSKVVLQHEHIALKIEKSQARFTRIKNPKGADTGTGHFFLLLLVSGVEEDVYIPLSISSGKKVSGFMYYIEGTSVGKLSTAEVAVRGTGVTKVTLGTLLYAKVTKGSTAEFRLSVEMEGKVGKEYTIHFHELNYKQAPTDARYKKVLSVATSKILKFK